MGRSLWVNLFYKVETEDVYASLRTFFAGQGGVFVRDDDDTYLHVLRAREQDWTVLEWHVNWRERAVQREAQCFVSKALRCAGLFAYIYDGDFWGYEALKNGLIIDRFAQSRGVTWEKHGESTYEGNPSLIASEFPCVTAEDVVPILVKPPHFSDPRYAALNTKAHLQDEFPRFECLAVHDFLRLLRVRVGRLPGPMTFLAPEYRSFRVRYPSRFHPDQQRILLAAATELEVDPAALDPKEPIRKYQVGPYDDALEIVMALEEAFDLHIDDDDISQVMGRSMDSEELPTLSINDFAKIIKAAATREEAEIARNRLE